MGNLDLPFPIISPAIFLAPSLLHSHQPNYTNLTENTVRPTYSTIFAQGQDMGWPKTVCRAGLGCTVVWRLWNTNNGDVIDLPPSGSFYWTANKHSTVQYIEQ